MKTYAVIVTRDTTESCVVKVKAEDPTAAEAGAFDKVLAAPEDYVWEQDDTPNASKDPYVTGVDEDEDLPDLDMLEVHSMEGDMQLIPVAGGEPLMPTTALVFKDGRLHQRFLHPNGKGVWHPVPEVN